MKHESKGDAGEDYVNNLAYKSYLKYWCYPNPKDITGDKKEICDLLIMFRDVLLIISVKNHTFEGNYERYKKRVIEKSSNQLNGAERKLFNSSRDIFIKHPEREQELFNPKTYTKIFKITINVGEQFEFYDLGDKKEYKGIINILNKESFERIIQELNTIHDFTDYLEEREKLLQAYKHIALNCSESDLLAIYLRNVRKFPTEFYNASTEKISLNLKGEWQKYNSDERVKLKRDEDKYSYFIDNLVQTDVLPLPNGEMLAKELMALRRTERRFISKALLTLIAKYQKDLETEFARRYLEYNGFGYLMIYYSKTVTNQKDLDLLIFEIAPALYAYMRNCQEKQIIVLAGNDYLKQWKFGFFVAPELPYPPEAIRHLENLKASLGWFTNMKGFIYKENEYPEK
ncbi:hypothetical protein [Flavobacterium sp. AG291]|uniref:hypothetical protein n=1 Tax=Flavobacterium sp. AG291 TaxID=2184000 RepID=UPI000E0B29D8|nr:hypothetical protein [Flavobacterium sp. AG291]RDI14425.1 hypothetical protein DEU42_102118 [Flavobacterium sp. AG291]